MAISNGPLLNSTPAAIQQALSTNYLDLNTSTGWGQQYVPDLMEQEAEVFGPRTISGFLAQVGAEEAMSADQVIWSEQGRLHLSYVCKTASTTTILIQGDIDENNYNALGIETGAGATHGVRVNDTIIISDVNQVVKALVTSIVADTITIAPYGATTITNTNVDKGTTILVYGSEYGKGQNYFTEAGVGNATDSRGANQPSFLTYSNKPIILKDYYEVSGSDAARIGWVDVTSEMGASGYLWYL